MKITRRQLRRIIREELSPLKQDAAPQIDDSDLDLAPPAPQPSNQSVASPLQTTIDDDTSRQDEVLKAAEQRWGLPFTNRDIRLLLMKYLEKFDTLIAEKNFDDAATITGRTVDYINNLILKLDAGTAAYPAQSNVVDKNLSMFYYQTPDLGDEFKRSLLSRLDSGTQKYDWQVHGVSGDILGLARQLGARKELLDVISFRGGQGRYALGTGTKEEEDAALAEIRRVINAASGYDIIQKMASQGKKGQQSQLSPLEDTINKPHTRAMKRRMKDAENELISFNEFMSVASDDDGEFSLDMLLDGLDELYGSIELLSKDSQAVNPINRVILDTGGFFRGKHPKNPGLLTQVDNAVSKVQSGDFRQAAKTLRRIDTRIKNYIKPKYYARDDQRGRQVEVAKETAIRKISKVLAMVQAQMYDRDKLIKNRMRRARKGVESFLTLFESKNCNKILSESRWLKIAGIEK